VVVLVMVVVVVGVEHSSAVGGLWELAGGVEGETGETGLTAGPPFGVDSSPELTSTMFLCGGG
jgi:hypothetical protein